MECVLWGERLLPTKVTPVEVCNLLNHGPRMVANTAEHPSSLESRD